MSQLSRISRGVRAALRNLPSTFLIHEKRASSSMNQGLPNDSLNKSNPLKVSPSYFNHARFKKSFMEHLKIQSCYLLDYNELHKHLIDGLEVLSPVLSVWKVFYVLDSIMDFLNDLKGDSTSVRYIKVFQHGNPFGEAVYLTRYNGYDELITKLDQLFKFNGELISPSKSLLVVYIDNKGYMMVVGDEPWEKFCKKVRKIFIYTSDEFQKMNRGNFKSRKEEHLIYGLFNDLWNTDNEEN